MLQKVRVDKWLWAVRIFKSRTQATDACKANKITVKGVPIKASGNVERGTILEVKKEGYKFVYKVVDLIEKRVSAALAEPCYENLTPEDEINKFKDWYLLQKSNAEFRDRGAGRPTKKERREIDDFKEE